MLSRRGLITGAAALAAYSQMEDAEARMCPLFCSGGKSIQYAPRVWAFAGDSVTFGTGSTNPFGFAYISRLVAGTRNISSSSPINGVGGQTMAQIVARIPAMIAAGAKGIVIQGGITDAVTYNNSQAVFAASLMIGINYCKAAKLPFIVLTTTPTYGAGVNTPQILSTIYSYVQWVQQNVPALGGVVADTYTAVVDTPGPSGQMQTQYSNTATGSAGDGKYPGPFGHLKMGQVVGAALLSVCNSLPAQFNWSGYPNLHPNPLNTGAGPLPTAATYTNYGGASSTNSIVAGSGVLPAGSWANLDLVSNASNSVNTLTWTINSSNWSVGDQIAFGGYSSVTDVTSTYLSDVWNSLPTYSYVNVQANGGAQSTEFTINIAGQGPSLELYTIGVGTTLLQFSLQFRLKASGGECVFQVGDMYLYNLTRLGLVGTVV